MWKDKKNGVINENSLSTFNLRMRISDAGGKKKGASERGRTRRKFTKAYEEF